MKTLIIEYWLVQDDALDAMSLATINKQLAGFGIRAVDTVTVRELVSYVEDNMINDDII